MSNGEPARRVIDGRFELEARLGVGGMGLVWRARDIVLDRAVALKEVRPTDPGLAEYDPSAASLLRARVLREARALARVEHPNVVTIHHIVDGGEGTYPWLVMELVTGGSLQDRLERGPMNPAQAALLGRELLAALRAAHAVGIQHRDVKPPNVLLRPDGRPVLTDFGIAAIRESTVLTATGSMIGTPDFMAPERITGDGGDPGSDLWSLAMMLYVAVEGHHPLRRGATLATLAAVLSEQLPPPRQAGPLTEFLNAVLVKDPAARPDAGTMDRMLAFASQQPPTGTWPGAGTAPGTGPVAGVGPVPGPGTAPVATSFQLRPPAAQAAGSGSHGFGPPTPQDAAPHGGGPAPYPSQYPLPEPGPTRSTAGNQRRRPGTRWVAIGSAVCGTVLTGVLVWTLLPEHPGDDLASQQPGATPSASHSSSPTPATTRSTPQPQNDPAKGNLLTPAGIRAAVKEMKAQMGTDKVGRFVVYPEYISAYGMVKGSATRYDSYDYRVGQGVTRGSSSGTLPGGDMPVSLDAYNWDALPALISRAEKDLKVPKPTTRYLVIRQPNKTFNTPAAIAVYLADAYDGGYLEANPQGKVTKLMPAGD
ncbi:serine/threonine-protein kinase [Streptomyces sp. H39-S7]|uniref:serine/threonine-protein kinase n=1 Tax=Streptomyces sp. H39-S7 TaxID=3004357 RepID=UPI0022AEA693|nr:serine/threonine-protein kinase [Streptomyces sp. H39-S7]MCZ4121904.1 protein kinase [Streptomyces sp. H39-S7]